MTETNLTIYQGATFRLNITVNDDMDLTGFKVRSHIRKKLKSEDILIESTTENGRFTIAGSDLQWEIAADDTAALPSGNAVYDVEIESPSGEVTRILKGVITVDAEVTR